MGSHCILCGRRDKSVSYIRFPSNKKIRKQWLKFCRKSEKYLYDSHRVCTDHFKPEDLRKHSKCTFIQPEAVPCIYPVNEVFLKIENIGDDTDNKDNIYVSGITNNDLESQAVNDNINVNSQSTIVTERAHCSNERKCLNFHSNLVSSDDIDLKKIHESPVLSACTSICDSHPPMISDQRYPGDIRSLHLAASRQAKKAMKVMQHIIMQQRRKIQSLQKKYSRCKQRISLLKDLNKRNYIIETAADNLVCLNDVF